MSTSVEQGSHVVRIDPKIVNAAVKIRITLDKMRPKSKRYDVLLKDLVRLKYAMTSEEFTEYHKRIA